MKAQGVALGAFVGKTECPMSADQLLREGKLDEALAALQTQVRSKPADAKLRVFLFQLLAVQGNWERALTQLNVAGELDAAAIAMVQTYREAIRCELLRAEIFTGKRSPVIFGQPDEWLAHLMQAVKLTAQGQHTAAADLRAQAFDAAPATSGTIAAATLTRSVSEAPATQARSASEGSSAKPPTQPTPFEWLADADSRLGPVVEAIFNGRYYWVPLHRVQRLVVDPPTDLRDVVWMPAHFVWANGGDTVALLPTRYPGSETNPDPLIKLARKTDWTEPASGVYLGQGQRMLATDGGEFSLMDVREIKLNVSPEASPPPGT
jgi:type VI secretion system protein ImpE